MRDANRDFLYALPRPRHWRSWWRSWRYEYWLRRGARELRKRRRH